jgi:hypothetical protein
MFHLMQGYVGQAVVIEVGVNGHAGAVLIYADLGCQLLLGSEDVGDRDICCAGQAWACRWAVSGCQKHAASAGSLLVGRTAPPWTLVLVFDAVIQQSGPPEAAVASKSWRLMGRTISPIRPVWAIDWRRFPRLNAVPVYQSGGFVMFRAREGRIRKGLPDLVRQLRTMADIAARAIVGASLGGSSADCWCIVGTTPLPIPPFMCLSVTWCCEATLWSCDTSSGA